VHKVIDLALKQLKQSSEKEELARFVEAAQSGRPRAWRYVERLKAVCALTASANPELREWFRRVWCLEREVEALRQQSRFLMAQLEQAAGARSAVLEASASAAANANDFFDSSAADERITP